MNTPVSAVTGQERRQQEHLTVRNDTHHEPLRDCVQDALSRYFQQLDGHPANNLYQMVLSEVEAPLFESTMTYAQGNQTKAASLLGISRSTLRKKLALYGLD